jgi:hypothetical protein
MGQVRQLVDAWGPIVASLSQLSMQWNRPIVFAEVGYCSVDGANVNPAACTPASRRPTRIVEGISGNTNLQDVAQSTEMASAVKHTENVSAGGGANLQAQADLYTALFEAFSGHGVWP